MNWGHKITLVIIAFIIGMLSMVFVASKQTNDMIDKNYYDKELKYQTLIDAAHNLNAVNQDILIKNEGGSGVVIKLPTSLISSFSGGKVEFIRTDDQRKDVKVDFVPDSSGVYVINQAKFTSGGYRARIEWSSQGKPYYKEEDILIP